MQQKGGGGEGGGGRMGDICYIYVNAGKFREIQKSL